MCTKTLIKRKLIRGWMEDGGDDNVDKCVLQGRIILRVLLCTGGGYVFMKKKRINIYEYVRKNIKIRIFTKFLCLNF